MAPAQDAAAPAVLGRETRSVAGWTVHLDRSLLRDGQAAATNRALVLLQGQLATIERQVPPQALAMLRRVPLWISPAYPGIPPRAEYHPDATWLRIHGRDPAMARGVEFTNVSIFERECRRMPVFVLHELAHAYHHQVLGFDQPEIRAAYEQAKGSGRYDRVAQRHGDGRPNTFGKAYAMQNAKEYFAECSEAYFGSNDFYPFTREELNRHDPLMAEILTKLWAGSE